jgi:hypothetical protein
MSQTNQLDKKGGSKKPRMSQKEASYHETRAGLKAMAQAQKEGASPEAIDAMMEAKEYEVPGTGIKLQRLTLQVVWAMEAAGSAYVGEDNGRRAISSKDIAIGALCFSDPVATYRLAKGGKVSELEDKAFELAGKLDMPTLQTVNLWINVQFARAKKLSGEEGDEKAAEGNAPGAGSAPAPA